MKYLLLICSLQPENGYIDLRRNEKFALNGVCDRFHESRNGIGCLVMQLVVRKTHRKDGCQFYRGRPSIDMQVLEHYFANK